MFRDSLLVGNLEVSTTTPLLYLTVPEFVTVCVSVQVYDPLPPDPNT